MGGITSRHLAPTIGPLGRRKGTDTRGSLAIAARFGNRRFRQVRTSILFQIGEAWNIATGILARCFFDGIGGRSYNEGMNDIIINLDKCLEYLRACAGEDYLLRVDLVKAPSSEIRTKLYSTTVRLERGIYVISNANEVIYIGMSGRIKQNGEFKRQGFTGRLTTAPRGKVTCTKWWDEMLIKGAKSIEIISFDNNKMITPALAEALLLNAFYCRHRRLPLMNDEF